MEPGDPAPPADQHRDVAREAGQFEPADVVQRLGQMPRLVTDAGAVLLHELERPAQGDREPRALGLGSKDTNEYFFLFLPR